MAVHCLPSRRPLAAGPEAPVVSPHPRGFRDLGDRGCPSLAGSSCPLRAPAGRNGPDPLECPGSAAARGQRRHPWRPGEEPRARGRRDRHRSVLPHGGRLGGHRIGPARGSIDALRALAAGGGARHPVRGGRVSTRTISPRRCSRSRRRRHASWGGRRCWPSGPPVWPSGNRSCPRRTRRSSWAVAPATSRRTTRWPRAWPARRVAPRSPRPSSPVSWRRRCPRTWRRCWGPPARRSPPPPRARAGPTTCCSPPSSSSSGTSTPPSPAGSRSPTSTSTPASTPCARTPRRTTTAPSGPRAPTPPTARASCSPRAPASWCSRPAPGPWPAGPRSWGPSAATGCPPTAPATWWRRQRPERRAPCAGPLPTPG